MLYFISEYWVWELALIFIAIATVYRSFGVHRVPALRPISSPPPMVLDEQLRDLGFEPVESCDASMNPQVQMHAHFYVSGDRLTSAMITSVRSADALFSVVEFVSEFSPYATLTTSLSKSASIFRWPPYKAVLKAPWKKSPANAFRLHEILCRAAREELFYPVPQKTERFRESVSEHIRRDYEYQVKHGMMVCVAPDSYRMSLKGAIISVPLVWAKMTYPILYNVYRPSDAAVCRRFIGRLRKLRTVNEPTLVN